MVIITLSLQEIARVLAEDREDVMVDPIVYKACQPDILHYCFDVPAGEGRRKSHFFGRGAQAFLFSIILKFIFFCVFCLRNHLNLNLSTR